MIVADYDNKVGSPLIRLAADRGEISGGAYKEYVAVCVAAAAYLRADDAAKPEDPLVVAREMLAEAEKRFGCVGPWQRRLKAALDGQPRPQ